MKNDTIVALATPTGLGAIGIIRISGEEAILLAEKVFKGKKPSQQKTHTVHFGKIIDEKGNILDEVLLTIFCSPHSYTGENTVEIACHGSPYILQKIIELLIRQGGRAAHAGEFTMRAFLHGKLDLSQAEAVADLIASESEATHRLAIQQMRGGYSKTIQSLRQELIDFAALIELELDFAEEDVQFADRNKLESVVVKLQNTIQGLAKSFAVGNVLKNGVPVAIVGRPNAGKSTLLNTLLNDERAIVSDIAGTTRDTIEEVLDIEGLRFRLIDTAGIREASDKIEALGIEKTHQKIKESVIVLYIFDIVSLDIQEVQKDVDFLSSRAKKVLVVANQIDKHSAYMQGEHFFDVFSSMYPSSYLPISAKMGFMIENIKTALYRAATEGKVISENEIILTNIRHVEALEQADAALKNVLIGLDNGLTGDLLSLEIRAALHHIGSITGNIVPDDILGSIFSKFCIGK